MREEAPETGDVILHPAALSAALDLEAGQWVARPEIQAWVAQVAADPQLERLVRFGQQCFHEGLYQGAINVIEGKPLTIRPFNG